MDIEVIIALGNNKDICYLLINNKLFSHIRGTADSTQSNEKKLIYNGENKYKYKRRKRAIT